MHQPDQLMQKDLAIESGDPRSSGRSGQILTGTGDFVPTGLDPTELEAQIASDPHQSRDELGREVDWQTAMKRAVRSVAQLQRAVGIQVGEDLEELEFPTFVPWEYIARIRHGDPDDPLLLQVMPVTAERATVTGFSADPVGDLDSLAAGGVIHKYAGRVLLISTGACGVHCRYCFRREFPYSESGSAGANWDQALRYVAQDRSIDEVILSGGDPLTLVDQKLSELIGRIEQIGHVRRLRIHSRMPIVIPQRVTTDLVDRLAHSRLTTWMVIHANHARELDRSVLDRLAMLIDRGIPVLNQAVLLRGVNDDAGTLTDLLRKLVDHRVQPYYLNQLDRVRGAAHFEVPVERGHQLIDQLRAALPGYAIPTYVTDQPGETSKRTLRPDCDATH